jgi:hypothetical protein
VGGTQGVWIGVPNGYRRFTALAPIRLRLLHKLIYTYSRATSRDLRTLRDLWTLLDPRATAMVAWT